VFYVELYVLLLQWLYCTVPSAIATSVLLKSLSYVSIFSGRV